MNERRGETASGLTVRACASTDSAAQAILDDALRAMNALEGMLGETSLEALSLMETRAADTISFGDRSIDIASSRSAGIQSVACLWGTKERELLLSSSPDVIISSPIEMISLIK